MAADRGCFNKLILCFIIGLLITSLCSVQGRFVEESSIKESEGSVVDPGEVGAFMNDGSTYSTDANTSPGSSAELETDSASTDSPTTMDASTDPASTDGSTMPDITTMETISSTMPDAESGSSTSMTDGSSETTVTVLPLDTMSTGADSMDTSTRAGDVSSVSPGDMASSTVADASTPADQTSTPGSAGPTASDPVGSDQSTPGDQSSVSQGEATTISLTTPEPVTSPTVADPVDKTSAPAEDGSPAASTSGETQPTLPDDVSTAKDESTATKSPDEGTEPATSAPTNPPAVSTDDSTDPSVTLTPVPTPVPTTEVPPSGGLSDGAIAGIVLGTIGAVVLVGAIVYIGCINPRRQAAKAPVISEPNQSQHGYNLLSNDSPGEGAVVYDNATFSSFL